MLTLYIHIPFCVRKCHYCGFYSTEYTRENADAYLSALNREAEANRPLVGTQTIRSIYIGGGTPTVLAGNHLQSVLALPRKHFPVAPGAEFTVEANPGSLTRECVQLMLQQGVNRLSLGIQSFSDELLAFLGRPHSTKEALDAYALARTEGLGNIGIDLIFGIPGQSMRQWEETLDTAIALRPEHISAYSLSLDEGSKFMRASASGVFTLPDDDDAADHYASALESLGRAGYEHYEISNFALPGFSCRHNLNYWQRGQYLGLGPAAWSSIGNRRYQTIPELHEYARRMNSGQPAIAEEETIDDHQAAQERVMLSLRTSRGLDLSAFGEACGAGEVLRIRGNAEPLKLSGLLEEAGGWLRLTRSGFLLANEVISRLSP
ncbi:MAG TPA: radical SAM family heme chaperone HemW [Nitrospirota bacterium]|nr:radical SAM family heme chaperone HemW [Nitrospirota bacterium]